MTPPKWQVRFFTIWTGQAFSLVGSALVRFALIWWMTETTGQATTLATAALVTFLPDVFLGPFLGPLIDRWRRRWILAIADATIAAFTAWLAYLYWRGSVTVWHIYAIMFVRALGTTFHEPTMMASTSLMVPQEQLTRVSGMNQTLQGIINIVTPPLGAFLITLLPFQGILAIDIATAMLAILPLFFIDIPQPQARAPQRGVSSPHSRYLTEIAAGFRFVWSWKGLFLGMSLWALLSFFRMPMLHLMPLFVKDCFGGGPLQYGLASSAVSAGMALGGLVLSVWGGFRRRGLTQRVGLLGYSACVLVLAATSANAFWLAVAALFVRGPMISMVVVPYSAIMQSTVPPGLQGRVFSLNRSLLNVVTPLGLGAAGPLADLIGLRPIYFLAGMVGLAVAGLWFALPSWRDWEDGPPEAVLEALREEGKGRGVQAIGP